MIIIISFSKYQYHKALNLILFNIGASDHVGHILLAMAILIGATDADKLKLL